MNARTRNTAIHGTSEDIRIRAIDGISMYKCAQSATGYVSPSPYTSQQTPNSTDTWTFGKTFGNLLANRSGLAVAKVGQGVLSIGDLIGKVPGLGFLKSPNGQKFLQNYIDWNRNDYKNMLEESGAGSLQDNKASLYAGEIGSSLIGATPEMLAWDVPFMAGGKLWRTLRGAKTAAGAASTGSTAGKVVNGLTNVGVAANPVGEGIMVANSQLSPGQTPAKPVPNKSFWQSISEKWGNLSPGAKVAIVGALGFGGVALLASMMSGDDDEEEEKPSSPNAAYTRHGQQMRGYPETAKEWVTRNAPVT